jgi:hypothetical protein
MIGGARARDHMTYAVRERFSAWRLTRWLRRWRRRDTAPASWPRHETTWHRLDGGTPRPDRFAAASASTGWALDDVFQTPQPAITALLAHLRSYPRRARPAPPEIDDFLYPLF